MMQTEYMKGLTTAERIWQANPSLELLSANAMGYYQVNRNDRGEVLTDEYLDGFNDFIKMKGGK